MNIGEIKKSIAELPDDMETNVRLVIKDCIDTTNCKFITPNMIISNENLKKYRMTLKRFYNMLKDTVDIIDPAITNVVSIRLVTDEQNMVPVIMFDICTDSTQNTLTGKDIRLNIANIPENTMDYCMTNIEYFYFLSDSTLASKLFLNRPDLEGSVQC